MTEKNNGKGKIKRRDFLAGTTAALSLAALGLPMPLLADPRKMKRAAADAKIVKVGIYPPIGVCRVGSAKIMSKDGQDQTVAAPEVPGIAPTPEGGFKVGKGSIKKQVQRFFVYGFDADGNVVAELTNNSQIQIEWTVRVANTKAAWYGFNNPMNLEENGPGTPAQLRNSSITGEDRENMLVIDSGSVPISGNAVNSTGKDSQFSLDGTFWGQKTPKKDYFKGRGKPVKVNLGKLQTDAQGRLKVVPADGQSESVIPDNPIVDFTKNDAWYDDWCDGTVHATVRFMDEDRSLSASPSWVACCGPDFAPEIPPFTTMYDRIHNTMVEKYQYSKDPKVPRPSLPLSFSKDVYPIFYRLGLMKWVATEALYRPGWIDVGDFSSMDYIQKLANNTEGSKKFREDVLSKFRAPDITTQDGEQYKMPYMAGGAIDYSTSPQRYYLMPDLQYWILQEWAAGNFNNDFNQLKDHAVQEPTSIEQLPLEEQPHALTKAALEPLSGGAFHPGVELTWILEQPQLFNDDEPFRLAVGNRELLSENMGRLITPENTIPPADGITEQKYFPIGPQSPGDLTRWMGLPWQPDAFSCQNINFANDFPTLVWWPALLPVEVFPEFAYQQISNPGLTREEKMPFINTRVAWARGGAGIGYHANGSYFDGLNRMVYAWEQMGFVLKRKTPDDLVDLLGDYVYVEVERGSMDLEFLEKPNLGRKI